MTTEQTKLHLDLADEASARLRRWTRDTLMRCEIAELDNAYTLAIIEAVLVRELLVMAKPRMPLHRFLVVMKEAYTNFATSVK